MGLGHHRDLHRVARRQRQRCRRDSPNLDTIYEPRRWNYISDATSGLRPDMNHTPLPPPIINYRGPDMNHTPLPPPIINYRGRVEGMVPRLRRRLTLKKNIYILYR